MSWADVKKLDINAKHPKRSQFPVTRVALLSEMVEECLRLDVLFIIDIKCYDIRAVSAVLALYEKFPKMYEMALISSFNPQVVYERQGPSQRRFDNPLRHLGASLCDVLLRPLYMTVLPYLLGLSVLLLEKDSITQRAVARARELELRMVAWTVNEPVEKEFLVHHLGVPYLTDALADDRILAKGQ
ncbi:Glycerophosphodiester phosphodiesterase 1 [Amphibalanus amphitrite]|uniref:Glycerophosphodiester phosphodiesterase 1 n=1 Tax=Amphibalanus amphitrite TaxID=1232801 RepID=A0A6A4WSS4_AMPAM|nr:Glycerophosphodiester phosphodiesterase 1 [Amphibalanus amphitrite]